jgi:hypothetical protein
MVSGLELWLKQATRHLSGDSAVQVRTEIREHYESAREAAISGGANPDKAAQMALTALGDPKRANRQYRKVLLTSAEVRLLREGNWESRAICSHRLMRSVLLGVPLNALLAATILFCTGAMDAARILLVGGLGLGLLFMALSLPIYTPSRSRIFRYVKWVVLAGMPVLAFGPDAYKFSWLLISSLFPIAWVEWTRISIRRKLPVAQWPKHLYL